MDTTDKAFQTLILEPLEVERGTEVQQLTSNKRKRKCLQKPSKSCCVIIGYVALSSEF